jgi:hypothetical protein
VSISGFSNPIAVAHTFLYIFQTFLQVNRYASGNTQRIKLDRDNEFKFKFNQAHVVRGVLATFVIIDAFFGIDVV